MNFASTVLQLCSSFKSYRQFRDVPVTSSVKYLLKLMALLALVLMASFVPWALRGCAEFARRFDLNRPVFTLHDGKLTSTAAQPAYWGDSDLMFVLDTTGKVTKPDPAALRGILFMADKFLFWVNATNVPEGGAMSREQNLAGFPDGTVDGSYIRRLMNASLLMAVPLSWVLLILGGALTCLFQAYLFSLAASVLERTMTAPFRLNQLLNIAIHAVTPGAIIVTTYTALRLQGIDLWLVYLIAYGIFLVGATNASRDKLAPEEHGDDGLI